MLKRSKKKTTPRRSSPRKRNTGGKSRFSGIGRYIVLLALIWAGGRYVCSPMFDRVRAHPVFTVRNVVVEGADYIGPEMILKTAGVEPGVNIFDLGIEGVADTLEKTFVAEDFTVVRRLPDTVAIVVTERMPVALISGDELVGVDRNGVPLPHVGASLAETLPIITGVGSVNALADSSVRERVVKGIELMGRIAGESPSVYKRISEVNVADMSEMGITLIDNGLEVLIGNDDWSRKIPMLEKVINRVPGDLEKIKAIDIRFAEKVFVRRK